MGVSGSKTKSAQSSAELDEKEDKKPEEKNEGRKPDANAPMPKSAFKLKPKSGFQELAIGAQRRSHDMQDGSSQQKVPLMTQYVPNQLSLGPPQDQNGHSDREEQRQLEKNIFRNKH